MARVGWYRLPHSGVPFYGPVPDGAELIEEPVAGGDGGAQVGAGVLVDQQPAQAEKVVDGPSVDASGEQAVDGDDQVGGQDTEVTP